MCNIFGILTLILEFWLWSLLCPRPSLSSPAGPPSVSSTCSAVYYVNLVAWPRPYDWLLLPKVWLLPANLRSLPRLWLVRHVYRWLYLEPDWCSTLLELLIALQQSEVQDCKNQAVDAASEVPFRPHIGGFDHVIILDIFFWLLVFVLRLLAVVCFKSYSNILRWLSVLARC